MSAVIIKQLVERISEVNHGFISDNYFSTHNTLQYLQAKSIFAEDTVRINRFSNPKLPSDGDLKTKGRGAASNSASKDVIVIKKRYDNKPVIT